MEQSAQSILDWALKEQVGGMLIHEAYLLSFPA